MIQLKSAEPLNEEPRGYAPPEEREQALMDALKGVELGDYDGRVISWMVTMLDTPTTAGIVSLFLRVRAQGMVDVVRLEEQRLDARSKRQPWT